MRPEFGDMLKILNSSRNIAQFCLHCPLYGIVLDNKTVEAFTLNFIEDVVSNSIASNSDIENAERYNKLTYSAAQQYCLFIRETSMLDAAVSVATIQHIMTCFYGLYVQGQAKIATERECAKDRDAILALFFKSVETRKPGLLKSLKTADKRNLLYLLIDYSNMADYLSLMKEFVDDNFLSKGEVDDTSYETLKMTFGHAIRSLVSCGVDPYEKTNEGKSFVDLAISENFYKLMHENYDGYIEAKEIKTEEQTI